MYGKKTPYFCAPCTDFKTYNNLFAHSKPTLTNFDRAVILRKQIIAHSKHAATHFTVCLECAKKNINFYFSPKVAFLEWLYVEKITRIQAIEISHLGTEMADLLIGTLQSPTTLLLENIRSTLLGKKSMNALKE